MNSSVQSKVPPSLAAWNPTPARRLRVLHFASVINRHDFIDTIIAHLDKSRFTPMACTFSKAANIEATEYEGVIPSFSLEVKTRGDYPRAIVRLASILKKQSVDVLHAHHYYEAIIGAAAVAMVPRCNLVVGRHYRDAIYLLAPSLRRSAYLTLERLAYRAARTVVVPSFAIRKLMQECQAVPDDKVTVIPYGFEFDADKYCKHSTDEIKRVLAEFRIPRDRFVFGNFGRLHRLKNQESLLRAYATFVKNHSGTTLLIVGDGPDGVRLRALAGQLDLNRADILIFAGWRQDALRILEAIDVVVHPSLSEAFSQVMVEAMAKAKPLIITNVAVPDDHARHLETAFVIDEANDQSICDALSWMYHNRAEAQTMANNASSYVRSVLSAERITPRFEALYESVAC